MTIFPRNEQRLRKEADFSWGSTKTNMCIVCSIAIVGDHGWWVALQRMDGAPHSHCRNRMG